MGPTKVAARYRKGCAHVKNMLRTMAQAVDLLDVVLLAALSFITSGMYQLAGSGWACLVLGALLLGLVMIGVPTEKPLAP
jgi:hypothetical protein